MSNVLGDHKQQQVLALGRSGWSLRRIEQATTVRRETVSAYLKAAGARARGPTRSVAPKPAPRPRRRIAHIAVTAQTTAVWTARQLREAFPSGQAPGYLIRDRDMRSPTWRRP